jgi:hypothetical protein
MHVYVIAALAGLAVGAILAWVGYRQRETAPSPSPAPVARAVPATTVDTPHYRLRSSADPDQTRQVAERVEALHAAFLAFHPELPAREGTDKLQLVLYRDQAHFKANNRSKPWAEAYYLAPASHAYYDTGSTNPTHWMLHEATHQLAREVARFPKRAWSDEGMATYFSTSRLREGRLVPGSIDPDTYPIWWLADLAPTGDRERDFAEGRLVPLRALITGEGGPPIDRSVNQHYVGYWSLVHFLLHHDGGRHADAFRTLLATGGGLAEFERLVGPLDRIEPQWYDYLRARVAELHPEAPGDDAVVVDFQ